MAYFVGNTSVYPGVLPTPHEAARGSMLYSNGSQAFWSYPGEGNLQAGSGWRYRTILTHGYIAAGYKGSTPWRSLNKTWHATDITVYCGEQLDRAVAYVDGTFSDYNAYVHGTSGQAGLSAYTCSYNLHNGVKRQAQSRAFTMFGSGTAPYGYMGNNPSGDGLNYGDQSDLRGHGGWDLSASRGNHGCASTQGGADNGAQAGGCGYVYGGGTTVTDKMHFPSETMYATTASPVTWGATDGVGGRSKAYILGNSTAAGCQTMAWSNDTFSTWAFNSGTSDGNNKSLMSKYGHGYFSVGGNTDSRRWKFNDETNAYISQLTKLGNFGEENQQMGQDWGYMLGNYNSQQNNWTTKTTYSTDIEVTLTFAAQPKGHYGTSSGCCSSAAASIASAWRA